MVTVRSLVLEKDQKHLSAVKRLGRDNSATLGFFPSGAFDEYGAKGQILIAIDESGSCVGYLLYRTSRQIAIIVHLCVSVEHRALGVAKLLIDTLKLVTRDLHGIRLSCRRDFSASQVWPKFGFIALSDRPGRSLEGSSLTTWWFDHDHPTLFSQVADLTLSEKIQVVIDANIFFDLAASKDIDSDESKALTADWVLANVELCVTREIWNEIDRQPDPVVRERERRRAHSYICLRDDHARYECLEKQVRELFEAPMSIQDRSDARQIAHALAGDAKFFVTRDEGLLDLSDPIYDKFGISVLRPADLIVHLDRLESETDYLPVRLAGTDCVHRAVEVGELDELVRCFQQRSEGENSVELRRKLAIFVSDPRAYSCRVVVGNSSEKLALYVYRHDTSAVTDVVVLRLKNFSLGKTLARYLATTIHLYFSSSTPTITKIVDPFLQPFAKAALIEAGFVANGGHWFKIGIPEVGPSYAVLDSLRSLEQKLGIDANIIGDMTAKLDQCVKTQDSVAGADIERALWPAKITDLSVYNYVVPIQPAWAKDLFDETLASEDIFGARMDLALQQEAVYYRKNRFITPRAPGRILWYVSHRFGYGGSSHLRACSRLDEVLIGKPKELYRRFRRLGVYDWKNVYQTAEQNIDTRIMVLRFSHTEQIASPVSWRRMQEVLKRNGIHTNLQSPVEVDARTFIELYQLGKNNAKTS